MDSADLDTHCFQTRLELLPEKNRCPQTIYLVHIMLYLV